MAKRSSQGLASLIEERPVGALRADREQSSPAYSDAQPICGIGNRSLIQVCQAGSSRSTVAFALAP